MTSRRRAIDDLRELTNSITGVINDKESDEGFERLHLLDEKCADYNFPNYLTWPIELESEVEDSLTKALVFRVGARDRYTQDLDVPWIIYWTVKQRNFTPLEPLDWAQLFYVTERLSLCPMEGLDANLEVWQTSFMRLRRNAWTVSPVLLGLAMTATAETHINHGDGWHIHPTNKKGAHYPLRLLFDDNYTQNDLAWERHGTAGAGIKKNDLLCSDPSTFVLEPSQSEELHKAALTAVLRAGGLPKMEKYGTWARRFISPGKKSFIAHPPLQPQGYNPVPWTSAVGSQAGDRRTRRFS